jgi:hypothetical protein
MCLPELPDIEVVSAKAHEAIRNAAVSAAG